MENENHKRKNDLMKSIMSDPKMARSFKEALSSPIGSTKREQAKSLLSIMKKVGGLRNDGMGGPTNMSMAPVNQSSPIVNPSSSNYYIFPAVPKLKSTTQSQPVSTPASDPIAETKNMFTSNPVIQNVGNIFSSAFSNIKSTTQQPGAVSGGSVDSKTPNMSMAPSSSNPNMSMASSSNSSKGPLPGLGATRILPTVTGIDAIKKLQSDLNEKNKGQQGWIPLVVDGIMGKKTTDAQSFAPSTLNNTNNTGGASSNFASSKNVFNIAASSVATLLKLTPTTPLKQVPIQDLAAAIATNEGFFNGTSKIAIANNNPGNLKFANQKGATQDSKGFAVFATVDEGAQALINDLTSKYNSGKYNTINDLMSVYSPDSDNPANPSYNSNSSSTGDQIKSDAQSAVNSGTGPGFFAMNEANAKFGGSLDQYITNLDEKLKKDFKLEPLELELSNLKSESSNFIPTLTSYMKGRDQYSKAIDKMIDAAQGDLLSVDMSDPASVERYNNYTTYLYTLKGRQNERYGNYLNAAVSDYNADVTKLQTNYDNVYKQYTDALTRQGTLAQNEYNTLYTTMSDLYTNLENAPTKAQNAIILQQQIDANNLTALQNGVDSTTYPDYYKDTKTFGENITDKDGLLLTNQLGAGGLLGQFNQAVNLSGQPEKALAVANAVNLAMAKTLAASTDPMADVEKFKGLVSDLASMEGGADYANMITPSLNKASYSLVSDYVLKNLPSIKKAATQLVSGKSHWFSKNESSGLVDESAWKKSFSNINSGVLDDLYNTAKINITPGSAYEKDPSTFVSALFSGVDDKSIANNLTSSIMSTW